MQARLIAYPPDAPATTRWIAPGDRLRIGRGQDCAVVLDHPSVSRSHAELYHDGDSWRLHDLASKNGSHLDGIAIQDVALPASCWLRLGDVHCEFEVFDREQAAEARHRQTQRRALSAALTRQVSQHGGSGSLPEHVLRGVVELAGCSRGFLLLADPGSGELSVRASLLLEPDVLAGRAFSGSVGAVQRVIATGRPAVVNDVSSQAWLAERASVMASGLQSLVCLPLLDGATVFGAVYADRTSPGAPITDFDLELLCAFSESATVYLLARRAMDRLEAAPRWNAIVERQAAVAAGARGDAAR
jgi:hypothetical protein